MGLTPDPCGVPDSTSLNWPLSRTPASSHRLIKRSTRGSAILCASIRINHPWSTESKKVRMSTSNAERAETAVSFRDVGAAHWLGPVLPAVDPGVQRLEIDLQIPLVVLHLHPIDPWTGRASLPPKRPFERGNVDVMQQCREPCLARTSGRLIHTLEVWLQGLPALCLALRLPRRDPFLPLPFLHHLVSFGDFIDNMERSDSHPRCGRTVVVPRSSPPSETNRWTLMGLIGSGMGLLAVT